MRVTSRLVLAAAVALLSSVTMHAQWVTFPTPGIPRTPDGKPNLNAPAPKTADGKPDLSGIWTSDDPPKTSGYFMDLTLELQEGSQVIMTPWAKALAEQRERRMHVDDPYGYCLPPGVPRIMVAATDMAVAEAVTGTMMTMMMSMATMEMAVDTTAEIMEADGTILLRYRKCPRVFLTTIFSS